MDYKISILIPVYNTEKYLRKCLESVINQTLEEIEIIITNDGSTDNSQLIIQEYMEKDSRIKVINQENQGLGATRNSGINLATGKYIAFLDSDDWIELNCYEIMYNNAEKNNSDLVITDYFVESLETSYTVIHPGYTRDKYLIDTANRNISGFSWNKLYKRDLIIKNNLKFPLRGELENVEDQYFSIRAIYLANKVTFTNIPLIHYVVRNESIVNRYQESLIQDGVELYRSTLSFFNELNSSQDLKLALDTGLLKNICQSLSNEVKRDNPNSIKQRIKNIKSILTIEEYSNCLDRFYESKKINSEHYLVNLSRETIISLGLLINKRFTLLYLLKYARISLIHLKQKKY